MYTNPGDYDRFMGRWSAPLAPPFLRFAGTRDARLVLDVGCGTGSLAAALAAKAPRARVVGLDPARSYVEHARQRASRGRVTFVVGIAEALPFSDGCFDLALALLVLQDFSEQRRAVEEMCRVTRRGGVIAACHWDFAHGMPMLAAISEALATAAQQPGKPASRRAYESEEELRSVWTEAGLTDVHSACLAVSVTFADFGDLWGPILAGPTPTTALVASLAPELRHRVGAQLKAQLVSPGSDGPFTLEARAFAVRGRRREF